MSNHLLVQLETKIDDLIETLEILRMQVADLEEKNNGLQTENATLKSRQSQWEHSLTTLLNKLDDANPESIKESAEIERFEVQREEALV